MEHAGLRRQVTFAQCSGDCTPRRLLERVASQKPRPHTGLTVPSRSRRSCQRRQRGAPLPQPWGACNMTQRRRMCKRRSRSSLVQRLFPDGKDKRSVPSLYCCSSPFPLTAPDHSSIEEKSRELDDPECTFRPQITRSARKLQLGRCQSGWLPPSHTTAVETNITPLPTPQPRRGSAYSRGGRQRRSVSQGSVRRWRSGSWRGVRSVRSWWPRTAIWTARLACHVWGRRSSSPPITGAAQRWVWVAGVCMAGNGGRGVTRASNTQREAEIQVQRQNTELSECTFAPRITPRARRVRTPGSVRVSSSAVQMTGKKHAQQPEHSVFSRLYAPSATTRREELAREACESATTGVGLW